MVRRLFRKLGDREGFTLIELLVVVAILALLAAIAAPKIGDVLGKSRDARKKADIKVVTGSLERYLNDRGQYPDRLQELVWEGYLKADFEFKNAWGHYYFYAVDDPDNPQHYVLGDPGKKPESSAGVYSKLVSGKHEKALPAGKAPDETAYFWKNASISGSSTVYSADLTVYKVDDTPFTAQLVPASLARYCASWSNTENKCTDSPLATQSFRLDLVTD